MAEWKKAGSNGGYETWTPENEGDELVGIYQLKSTNVGPNKSNVYEVKRHDGTIVSLWGSTVIDSKFDDPTDPITVGEEVRIVFNGKRVGKRGGQYKDFSVFHRVYEPSEEEKTFAS